MSKGVAFAATAAASPSQSRRSRNSTHQQQDRQQQQAPLSIEELKEQIAKGERIRGGAIVAIHAHRNNTIIAPDGVSCQVHLVDATSSASSSSAPHGCLIFLPLPSPSSSSSSSSSSTDQRVGLGSLLQACYLRVHTTGDLRISAPTSQLEQVESSGIMLPAVRRCQVDDDDDNNNSATLCDIKISTTTTTIITAAAAAAAAAPAHAQSYGRRDHNYIYTRRRGGSSSSDAAEQHHQQEDDEKEKEKEEEKEGEEEEEEEAIIMPIPALALNVAYSIWDSGIIGRAVSIVHISSGEILGDGIVGWNSSSSSPSSLSSS